MACNACDDKSDQPGVKWAAWETMPLGDELIEQPQGPACGKCYTKAVDVLGYARFSDCCDALDNPEVRERSTDIDKNMAKPGSSVDWEVERIFWEIDYEVESQVECAEACEAVH